jgi:quercetin dioxygenase-like cupin family protein
LTAVLLYMNDSHPLLRKGWGTPSMRRAFTIGESLTHIRLLAPSIQSGQIIVPCSHLPQTLAFFSEQLGFRVDLIFPADSPSTAVISGHGVTLRLELSDAPLPRLRLLCDVSSLPKGTPHELVAPNGMRIELVEVNPPVEVPEGKQEFVIGRVGNDGAAGRAGMQYRDLIPSRLGGRFVASHIKIPAGGEVPDYVHYHRVRFQMIFCKAGWVRVVYEDQGPPFVMQAGDCVLQPPEIRHRVLEASPGLEVIEIGCPAVHETWADHELLLPNGSVNPDREWSGQRFMRHMAASAKWVPWMIPGFEARDTGIAAATSGLASVRVVHAKQPASGAISHEGEFLFFFVLRGELGLRNEDFGSHQLQENESCVLPAGAKFELMGKPDLEMLEVEFPRN